ncbi:TMEM175 family protein, partial [Oenococcus oeni]
KDRLDTFVDAILAIIATVMVLELPIKIVNRQIDFVNLFISIGVYLVSFCFLANI